MKKLNPKQFWTDLETLYIKRLNSFLSLAKDHLINQDYAIDAVHQAFEKVKIYHDNNPERNLREQIVRWLILKECRRMNKMMTFGSDWENMMHLSNSLKTIDESQINERYE